MSSPTPSFQAVIDRAMAICTRDPCVSKRQTDWGKHFDEEFRKELEEIEYKQRLEKLIPRIEELEEFTELEQELLPLGLGHEVGVVSMSSSTMVTKGKEVRAIVPLSEVFDRLGLYQQILEGEPSEAIWHRLDAALKLEGREIKTFFLLEGCDFPREFRLFNCFVRRLRWEDKIKLGPRRDERQLAVNSRFKHDRFDGTWFLEHAKEVQERLVSYLLEPDTWKREDLIDEYWLQLLTLGLCHPGLFNITSVIESKPGWDCRATTVSNLDSEATGRPYESPGRDDETWSKWADDFYWIGVSDWKSFDGLVNLIQKSLASCVRSQSWDFNALVAAARWYLRGRFMEHPDLETPDDPRYKDVLLYYVTCLENLLMLPDEKETIGDKLSSRGAWIAGRSESERVEIAAFLKKVYQARSRTVHRPGKKPLEQVDFKRLRDICRRVFACELVIAGQSAKEGALDIFLKNLLLSTDSQRRAQKTAKQIGSLSRCW